MRRPRVRRRGRGNILSTTMPADSPVLPRFATSPDGARIAFDAEGAGPAIIPLHGGGQTRRGWREAGYVSALSPEFTVISMDLRGSGESDKPETARDYAVSRLVEDYPEVEPEDMKCPTLWLVGTLNEPAMAGVEACRDRLTGTRVTLATIEGLNHPQELERADRTLPLALEFTRSQDQ